MTFQKQKNETKFIIFQDEFIADASNLDQNLDSHVEDSPAVVKNLYKSEKKFSDLDQDLIVAEVVSEFKWNSVKVIANQNNVLPSTVENWVLEAGFTAPDEIVKSAIIKQCLGGEVSPEKLAQINNCHSNTVRKWAKEDGGVLPGKYAQQLTKSPNVAKLIFKCQKQNCSFETNLSQLLAKHGQSKIACFYHPFISAIWARRVHSILSGFGVPYFFLARCFFLYLHYTHFEHFP